MKKVFSIFQRDLKIVLKDPLALWIFIAPLLLAVIINAVSPGINDTTVNLAIHSEVDNAYINTVSDFANIEVYDTLQEVEARVLKRDEVIGVKNTDDGISVIAQGNESETSIQAANLLNALYRFDLLDVEKLDSRLSLLSFGEEVPALKRTLSVTVLLLITIVSAMIIALGLVDEKNDKTIKAANVTPIKQVTYMLSKSAVGVVMLLIVSVASLFILGLTDINFVQMLIMIFSISLISIIFAFAVGLASSDFIEAAASIKMLMLPLAAGILIPELVADKWHFTVYWSPFYWAYKGMTEVLNKTATFGSIGMYTLIIVFICLVCFMLCKKNIRKHLN